jgi:RNA polymerase sigma-70 factor (ECF subfamily)
VKVSTSAPPPTAAAADLLAAESVERRRAAGRVIARPEITGTPDFRFIYDNWFDDVCRWIRALGGREADRDDIVQEVFLVVRRRLAQFDGANPGGWLYRITRRQVRDFRNRTWIKHIFTGRRSDDLDELPSHKDGPATTLERKQKQRVLEAILAKMGTDRRSAFVLFEIEGLSGEEIARLQGIPLNTVWGRLRKARQEFFTLAARFQRAHADEITWSPPGNNDGPRGRRP